MNSKIRTVLVPGVAWPRLVTLKNHRKESSVATRVQEYVALHPGVTVVDVVAAFSDVKPVTVRNALDRLWKVRRLRAEKINQDGRYRRSYTLGEKA